MKSITGIIKNYFVEEFLDSHQQIESIDDWHYTIQSDLKLWKKKEKFLAERINSVLLDNRINYVVEVRFISKTEDTFILDLGKHYIRPYYMVVEHDNHYHHYCKECNVYESIAAARMQILEYITYLEVADDVILSKIERFFRTGMWSNNNEYYLITILSETRLKTGDLIKVGNLSNITLGLSDSPYISNVQTIHKNSKAYYKLKEGWYNMSDPDQCIFQISLKNNKVRFKYT